MFWWLGSDGHCLVFRKGQKGITLLTTEIYLNLSPEHVVEEFQQKW